MNVLFIRGLTRESRHWGGFEQKFQKKYPEAKVFSIDLPGAGTYFEQTSPSNLDDYVFFLREKLGPNIPVVCIGISMGGMIALRWAELFPDEINKVFAINSSAKNLSSASERFNLSEYKKILGIFLSVDPRLKEERILALSTEMLKISDNLLDQFGSFQKTNPVSLRSSINQLWAASTFSIDHPLKCEVVIISGARDRLVSKNCSKALSVALGARLIVHPEAGHDLPLDDPDWLLSELRL